MPRMSTTLEKPIRMFSDFYSDFMNLYAEGEFEQVMIFSSLIELGFQKEDFLILASSFEALSLEGLRLVFPSFTYSSRRNGQFDAVETPPDPQNGAMSRLLFENKAFTVRTLDPDFSYLILDTVQKITVSAEHQFERSFGHNSYHEQLLKPKTGILLLGPVLNTGLTPVLHLESLFGVPWRTEIKTEYFCNHCQSTREHYYFARRMDYPKDQWPNRMNLKTHINSISKIGKKVEKNLSWYFFDWSEFERLFFKLINQNLFFQSLSLNESAPNE